MGANVFDEDRNDNGKSPKGTTILVLVIVGIVFLPCAVMNSSVATGTIQKLWHLL